MLWKWYDDDADDNDGDDNDDVEGRQIIHNYWRRLTKISWFVCGEQINYLRSWRLRQIIDLRDTDKSRCFEIAEFKNCFIIRSPSLFFLMDILGKRSDLLFSRKSDSKKRKHGFLYACAEYYLQSNTDGRHCAWADHYLQAVIAGHVVGSRPMKRKKNLLRMISCITGNVEVAYSCTWEDC